MGQKASKRTRSSSGSDSDGGDMSVQSSTAPPAPSGLPSGLPSELPSGPPSGTVVTGTAVAENQATGAANDAATYLPLGNLVEEETRQLLELERQLGDHLYSAYRGQVSQMAPTMRLRGELVGKALIDYFTGQSSSTSSYGDVLTASLADPQSQREPLVLDLMKTMDPLVTPLLEPFVEGVKKPIVMTVGDIESEVKKDVSLGLVAVGLMCGMAGFAIGRSHPKDGRRRR